jgi:hypothetical protein
MAPLTREIRISRVVEVVTYYLYEGDPSYSPGRDVRDELASELLEGTQCN